MDTVHRNHRGRVWFFAVTGALLIGLVMLGLFRVPATPLAPLSKLPSRLATVEMAPGNAMIHEQASFYDPKPLFLPTPWNAKPNVLPGSAIREPGDEFRYEAPFAVNAARLAFPTRVNVPDKPVDALGLWAAEAPFLGMGQADLKVEPLPVRDARMEVVTAGDGRQVFTEDLKAARPPGGGDWQPLEFLVAVDPAGLVGLPVPVPSPNAVEVAAFFQNYLAKVFRVGERLAPGFYRIKVGP